MVSIPQTQNERSRRERLRFILPAGLAMALALAGDLTLYTVLPAYADRLGISLASVGLVLSANRLVRFASNPLVGLLANRVSRRTLVLSGFVLGLFSTLLYVTQNLYVILLGRLLWGVAWSIMYIGLYCIILDVTGEQERGWGTGMLQTFFFIGIGVTPVAGGLLSDWLGFQQGLLACTALQGLGLLIALIYQPETYTPDGKERQSQPLREGLRKAMGKLRRVSFTWLLHHREILLANYLYMATLFVGDGIIMSTITLYLQQRYGDAIPFGLAMLPVTAVGGGLLALRALISGSAAPLTGHWSDRLRSRWVAVILGAVVATVGCALLAMDGNFGVILLGVILASLGSGMMLTVLPAIVSSTPGQQGSFAMGMLVTSGDLGSAIAPLVGYAMLKIVSLGTLYLATAGLLVIGIAAWLALARYDRPRGS